MYVLNKITIFLVLVNLKIYQTVDVNDDAVNQTNEYTVVSVETLTNKGEQANDDSFFRKLINRIFPLMMGTNKTTSDLALRPPTTTSTTRTNQVKNYYRLTSFEKKFENFLLYYCVPFILWMSLMILIAYVCRRRLEYTRRTRRSQRSINRNYQILLALSPQNEFSNPPNYSKTYKADEPPSYESLQLMSRTQT
jgi:hypothetical protein